MKTIQMTLDEDLIKEVDKEVKKAWSYTFSFYKRSFKKNINLLS
jgi:hypothetical protein